MTRHLAAGHLLAVLAGAAAAGCTAEPPAEPPSPETMAVVAGEEVEYSAFSDYVAAETASTVAALESEVLSRLLDQYVTERLLVRVAVDRGLAAPGSDHRRALAALLEAAPMVEPERSDLLARYRDEEDALALPARVRVRQILTETRAEAVAARAEVEAGADFAEVARRRSTDPSAAYGGDQGELAREDLPEELSAVIFALEPGEVSAIVEADYGFHVFQVTERLPERVVPFEEAVPVLTEVLREEGVDAWLRQVVEDARSRYTVRVYERNLPFEYRGPHAAEDPPADA